jgi:hypothetical protein
MKANESDFAFIYFHSLSFISIDLADSTLGRGKLRLSAP